MYSIWHQTIKNCISFWDPDPAAERTTIPILLAFAQLPIAASGFSRLQLPTWTFEQASSPGIAWTSRGIFVWNVAKFKIVGTWNIGNADKIPKSQGVLMFFKTFQD